MEEISFKTDKGWEKRHYTSNTVITDRGEIQLLRALMYQLSLDEDNGRKFFLQKRRMPEIKGGGSALVISGADIRRPQVAGYSLAASFGIAEIISEEIKNAAQAVCPKCGK